MLILIDSNEKGLNISFEAVSSKEDVEKAKQYLDAMISPDGNQAKSIHLNIDSFIKGGINIKSNVPEQMNIKEVERYMNDTFLRIIRNIETSCLSDLAASISQQPTSARNLED